MKTIFALLAGSACFVVNCAFAELKWEQTTLDLQPEIGAKEAVGHFKYQNVGDKPVRFKSVRTSCGCTAAQSQKEQVGPGEKGEITATFKVGDRTGMQIKTVTVETDDVPASITTLTLKANIAAILEIQPNFVYWQQGEEAKPKTIIARAGKDIPIKNLDVVSTNPDFLTKVEKGGAPGEFHINVQPRDITKPSFTTLTIKPDYPKETPKTYYATARVTGAPASAAR